MSKAHIITKKEAIEKLKPYARFLIKNVYDDLDFGAIITLNNNFEYPDWSHKRVRDLWKLEKRTLTEIGFMTK